MAEIFSGLASMPCSEKISYEVANPFGLDHDVVNVGLNGPLDEVLETLEHTMLVHSPSVVQTERHYDMAKRSEGGDERCHELVGLFHQNLMVPRVRVKEEEGFAPQGRINYLVYA